MNNLRRIKYPLAAQSVRNAFKLYFNDIGMLRDVAAVNGESPIPEKSFSFKGHYVENYVLQQLAGKTEGIVHYWAERAESEIDFVIQRDGEAVRNRLSRKWPANPTYDARQRAFDRENNESGLFGPVRIISER